MVPSSAFVEYEVTSRQRRVHRDLARRRATHLALAPSRPARRRVISLRRRGSQTVGECEPALG